MTASYQQLIAIFAVLQLRKHFHRFGGGMTIWISQHFKRQPERLPVHRKPHRPADTATTDPAKPKSIESPSR